MALDRKCKGEDHVDVVSTSGGGDPVGVWGVVRVEPCDCKNLRTYHGVVWVLSRHGKQGMQMLPELAAVMPARLRSAASGGFAARIRHRVAKIPIPYATLSHDAALDLADAIERRLAAP